MHRWLLVLVILATADRAARADDDPCAVAPDDPAPPATPREGRVKLTGHVRSKQTGEAAIGATVVATSPALSGEEVVISDENGAYSLDVPPGTYQVLIYYLATTVEVAHDLAVTRDTVLPDVILDESIQETGCTFWEGTWPEQSSEPRFGFGTGWSSLMPVARDRTHRAWIAPAAAANPLTAVAILEDAVRLAGAPGVPIAFLSDSSTYTMRAPIWLPHGTGGTAQLGVVSGSNQVKVEARTIGGYDRDAGSSARAQLVAGGPIVHDHAWLAAGLLAARKPDAHYATDGLLRLDVMPTIEHQLSLMGIGHIDHGDSSSDVWSRAAYTAKLDDGKLVLQAHVVGERLEAPAAVALGSTPVSSLTDRLGAQGRATLRRKAHGYHQLEALVQGGTGHRDLVEHRDASAALGDDWQIEPNVTLVAGVRCELRRFGDAQVSVIAPRASISWDPTKEGRADVFVAYDRIPHLDGAPGAWLTNPRSPLAHDEVATGFAWNPNWGEQPMMFGLAARARSEALDPDGERLGGEAFLRFEGRRTRIHGSATTLGRIATLLARRTVFDRARNDLFVATSLRASMTSPSEAGAAVTWKHTGGHHDDDPADLDVEITLEGFAGDAGPGTRLLVGGSW
ncbi:MAG TPA: carboxypeptidase-like regulatory domain-containing protein [Kofleriaceae bacterium]|nr:carboxypeptidase-like regulatory domain-containing protein [Kofleriaceae bacterium]